MEIRILQIEEWKAGTLMRGQFMKTHRTSKERQQRKSGGHGFDAFEKISYRKHGKLFVKF